MSTRLATPVKIRLRSTEVTAWSTQAPIRMMPMLITPSTESVPPPLACTMR